jgi:hypothetical protein
MSIRSEKETIAAMVGLSCRRRHGEALCPDCAELVDYAHARLDRCPYGDDKPTCAECSIHCYKPVLRERIREVMRFAGPRMPWRHPWLALLHVARSFKRPRSRVSARTMTRR